MDIEQPKVVEVGGSRVNILWGFLFVLVPLILVAVLDKEDQE